ncbi:unnamed protein product [Lactuca saligna]|uniref:Uncharacterized protein n=1 Tax=Lactuca saligna TaxID=75948 RepID=A0AA36E3U7_LACSI|nr:unnamed protein product [Lactuca saligna]
MIMCNISVKASCHKLHEILSGLNGPVQDIFSTTSFGYLLDLPAQFGDGLLIHGLLLHMLRPTAETDATERLHFGFSRRTLSFGPKEFYIVSGLYMGRCPRSMIEFSTMYKHRYGENTFRSRIFPYCTDTTLLVEYLELLILNQRFNDISAHDDVRAILLYILNQGSLEGVMYGLKHTLNCRGNENVDGNYRMPSPVGQQFGSLRNSNRINEDNDVDNKPKFDCRKQKQIVKEKKKKKVVDSDIVDAEKHVPEPPIAKPSRSVRLLKPSQYLSSPYISVQNVPRYRKGRVICNEPPPPYLSAIPNTFIGALCDAGL